MTASMDDGSRGVAHARRVGKRAGHAVVVVIAVVFIAASAVQIIPAVFHMGVRPMGSTPAGSPEDGCARGVRSLAVALDRARPLAWSARAVAKEEDAIRAFRQGLEPEWNEEERIRQDCDKSPDGADAWAALQRLKSAEEQVLLRAQADLEPLRRDVSAHLPADMR